MEKLDFADPDLYIGRTTLSVLESLQGGPSDDGMLAAVKSCWKEMKRIFMVGQVIACRLCTE